MRQMTATRFGPPDVLELREMPDPRPGSGEVVIDVAAVDVLFLETMIRAGAAPAGMAPDPPYVPGNGVAGTVAAVGDEVDDDLIGARVVAHTGQTGAYADRALVSAAHAVAIPDGVAVEAAAAMLHDGATAEALFDRLAIGAGDRVVVLGATGGLGVTLSQLARARAALVVPVARDARKLARLRELGFDPVDSGDGDWLAAAREALAPDGATVVLDNVGGALGEAAFALLAPGGRFSAHGTPSGAFAAIDPARAAAAGVSVTGIDLVQLGDAMADYTARALDDVAAGVIDPVVGQTFGLERAADAHAAIASRDVFGKTLLVTS